MALINEILDFSKIEADKMDLEHVSFNLERIASDVAGLLRPRPRGWN
jgi:two-component system, sensor histidine kinase and response regulator